MQRRSALLASLALLGACIYDWSLPEPQPNDDDAPGGSSSSSSLTSSSSDASSGQQGGAGAEQPLGGGGAGASGGAPPDCQPDGDDDACELCAKGNCCEELVACSEDPSCICWTECLSFGGDCYVRCGPPSNETQSFLVCLQGCPSCA